jgi:hypothetical protein
MTHIADPQYFLLALSARVTALEGAISALASTGTSDKAAVLNSFDTFSSHSTALFLGEPVSDEYLALLKRALAEVRAILQSGSPGGDDPHQIEK